MFITRLVVATILALLISSAPAMAKKIALVIGNAEYESVTALVNPPQDARLVAEAFKELGFEVLTGIDLDQIEFAKLLANFDEALEGAEAAAFYYAGHGIQFEGQNYLISTNATLDNAFLLSSETILLDAVISTMEAKSPVNMVFLDACRDNPFVQRLQSKLPRSRSAATREGLAPALGFGAETMIMYATASNAVALDGESENSPFARSLIKHLRAPDTEIGLAMKRVIRDVREETNGEQSPEMLTSVSIELYLNLSIGTSDSRSAKTDSALPDVEGVADLTDNEADQQLESLWTEGLALARAGKDKDYYATMDKAQKLASAHFGEDSLQYAQANNHLVGALTGLQRIEDAIYAAREAIRVYEKLYGKQSLQTANDKANLAARLHLVGYDDEAESKWLEAIAIYERGTRSGWDSVGYASALEGLAKFRADSGSVSAAQELFDKAISVLEESGNTRVINYPWLLANFGHFQRNHGDCEGAKKTFQHAVQAFTDAGVSASQRDHANAIQVARSSCS